MSIPAESRATPGSSDPIYTWAAIVALAVVLAGFARTYYAKIGFPGPELTALQHLHGLVMTAWFALFMVQARLVATGRVGLHRRVGVYGGIVAALVVIVGTITAISGVAAGRAPPGVDPLVFLAVPLGEALVFAVVVSAALVLRRRPEYHKRLMVVATLGTLSAANARIPVDLLHSGGVIASLAMSDVILLVFVAIDTLRRRKLHPAYAWGTGLVILGQVLRLAVAKTPQWIAVAGWLTR